MFKKSVLFVGFFALCINLSNAQIKENTDGYLLEYKPAVGRKGRMIVKFKMDMAMNVLSQSMNMKQYMEMAMFQEVTNQTSNSTTTESNYDYFRIESENPYTGKMYYDSRDTSNLDDFGKQMHMSMSSTLQTGITLVQDRTGRTIDSDISAEVAQNSNISSIMTMSAFPDKPVKIGDTWTSIIDDENQFMVISITYTLKEVTANKVIVSFTGTITKNLNYKGSQDVTGINGNQSGELTYDIKDMWLLGGFINQKMDMNMNQMGNEIESKIANYMNFEVE